MSGRKVPRYRRRWAGAVVSALPVVVLVSGALPGSAKAHDHRRPSTGTVWVTDQAGGGVLLVDAGSGEVMKRIQVGTRPIGVIAPPGSAHVYVSNESDNTVSVIDKKTLDVVETIGTGSKPHHMATDGNGGVVYVAEFGGSTVAAIDTTTHNVTTMKASKHALAQTHAVWVSTDGKSLYAANSRVNTVGVIDTRSGELVEEINVGKGPSEILVTRDGKTAYVSARGANEVQVIDLASQAVIDVAVGPQPDTLQLTNDGRILVVALRGSPAQVALVDTSDFSVRSVNLAPHSTTGHHWLSADGRFSFVAVEGPAGVAVIDNQAGTFVEAYSLGIGPRPHGVFYEPDRPRA